MEIKSSYLGTMIGLATVAFGLLAAGAWNAFIKDLIGIFLQPGKGLWAELLYAVLVTLLAIWVIGALGRLAAAQERQSKP